MNIVLTPLMIGAYGWQDLPALGFISMPGGWEMLVVAVIGLLIFGKRLPEVGRSLGKGIVEFKKGVRGIEDEMNTAVEKQDQSEMLPPPEQQNSQATQEEKQKQPAGESTQNNSTQNA
jgi:sec-independent protein translocase protein TatA